jgi:hypothetical protein
MSAKGELADMFKTDFLLMSEHNISLSDINNMLPFERKIFISIIIEHLNRNKN